jgi:epidermal growth factor receptor substrate 15
LPSPTTPVLDSGAGAAAALGAPNWGLIFTADNALRRDGAGHFQAASTPANSENRWILNSFSTNQEAYCTVSTLPAASSYVALYTRISAQDGTGYEFEMDSPASGAVMSWKIMKFSNSATFTELTPTGGVTSTAAAGDQFLAQSVGSTHSISQNGTTLITRTDTQYAPTTGYLGMQLNDATVRITNFGGGVPVTTTAFVSGRGRSAVPRGRQFIGGPRSIGRNQPWSRFVQEAIAATPITDGDANSVTDEAVALIVALLATETNSTTTEVLALLVALTDSDAGTSADAVALVAALTDTDTGSGIDSAAVTVPVAGADTGAGTETAALTAALGGSEAGVGSDSGSVASVASTSDTGAGSDTSALAAVEAAVDTASGADSATVTVPIAGSETGTETEVTALTAALSDPDTGTGADAPSLTAALGDADAGAATDAVAETAVYAVTDISAVTAESASVAVDTTQIADADADGPVSESELLAAIAADSDAGTGAEQLSLVASASGSDTAGPTGEGATVEIITYIFTSDFSGPTDESAVAAEITIPITPGGGYAEPPMGVRLRRQRISRVSVTIPRHVYDTNTGVREFAFVTDQTKLQREAEEELLLMV